MAKYRKKPIEVESFKFGQDMNEWPEWFEKEIDKTIELIGVKDGMLCSIDTVHGYLTAREGDYII